MAAEAPLPEVVVGRIERLPAISSKFVDPRPVANLAHAGGDLEAPHSTLYAMRTAIEAGADMLDIGGESTRPGAQPEGEEDAHEGGGEAEPGERVGEVVVGNIDDGRAAGGRAARADGEGEDVDRVVHRARDRCGHRLDLEADLWRATELDELVVCIVDMTIVPVSAALMAVWKLMASRISPKKEARMRSRP